MNTNVEKYISANSFLFVVKNPYLLPANAKIDSVAVFHLKYIQLYCTIESVGKSDESK